MQLKDLLLSLTILSFRNVCCDDCVTHDFGDSFEEQFTVGENLCNDMRPWQVGNYSEVDVTSPPNVHSSTFVSPQILPSCASSFVFSMQKSGFLDVKVYMKSSVLSDFIVVLVQQINPGELNDPTVAMELYSPQSPNFVGGWQTLRLTINTDSADFEGYIILMGMADASSTVLIDSFRYVNSEYNEQECVVYSPVTEESTTEENDDVPSTTDPTDDVTQTTDPTNDVTPTTNPTDDVTQTNDPTNDVTQTTGTTNDVTQTTDATDDITQTTDPTNDVTPTTYPNDDVTQTADPTNNVTPTTDPTDDVTPTTDPTNDVTPTTNPTNDVTQTTDPTNDVTPTTNPTDDVTQTTDPTNDVTPTTDPNDNVTQTTDPTDDVTQTTDPTDNVTQTTDRTDDVTPTTDPTDDVTQTTDPTDDVTQTTDPTDNVTQTTPSEEECEGVTNNFDESFSQDFGFAEICSRISAARWFRRAYPAQGSPIRPHELSKSYITPQPSRISCTSSFSFKMEAGGQLQLNVYMRPSNTRDYLTVRLYQEIAIGQDQMVYSATVNRLSPGFVTGMSTLSFTLPEDMETIEGYIALIGLAESSSIVAVDSFRYIPPGTNESNCDVYG